MWITHDLGSKDRVRVKHVWRFIHSFCELFVYVNLRMAALSDGRVGKILPTPMSCDLAWEMGVRVSVRAYIQPDIYTHIN